MYHCNIQIVPIHEVKSGSGEIEAHMNEYSVTEREIQVVNIFICEYNKYI
jgi:hypothetical protein